MEHSFKGFKEQKRINSDSQRKLIESNLAEAHIIFME
jgi:hypothetical protein